MDDNSIASLESDIQEAFAETGDSKNICIVKYLEDTSTKNVFDEVVSSSYSVPIIVTGRANLSPTDKQIKEMGFESGVHAIFSIASKELKDKLLLDVTTGKLTYDERAEIIYRGNRYNILKTQPKAMLGDTFLVYKIAAKLREGSL
jgi:hypothetical protein